MKRTDLMCEIADNFEYKAGVYTKKYSLYSYDVTDITADGSGSVTSGRYVTVHCGNKTGGGDDRELVAAVSELLSGLVRGHRVLVAGLGNIHITSDSLGAKALKHIPPTAHLSDTSEFSELGLREIYTIETGVMGQTGLESSEQLKMLCDGIKPQHIIAIDALACSSMERLCRTIQLTDAGIALGSGVGNSRRPLTRESIGVPVTAIGVPTVIDLKSLCSDDSPDFMVTPRSIDVEVNRYARIIGRAVAKTLLPTLTERETELLLF